MGGSFKREKVALKTCSKGVPKWVVLCRVELVKFLIFLAWIFDGLKRSCTINKYVAAGSAKWWRIPRPRFDTLSAETEEYRI